MISYNSIIITITLCITSLLEASHTWPIIREKLLEHQDKLPTLVRSSLPAETASDEDAAEWLKGVTSSVTTYISPLLPHLAQANAFALISVLLPAARLQNCPGTDPTECACVAADNGHNALVQLCLRNGAQTPRILDVGIARNNCEIVQSCINYDFTTIREKSATTISTNPLLLAAQYGHTDCVIALLEAGYPHTSVTHRTIADRDPWYGWNVREIARYYGHYTLEQTLKTTHGFLCRPVAKLAAKKRQLKLKLLSLASVKKSVPIPPPSPKDHVIPSVNAHIFLSDCRVSVTHHDDSLKIITALQQRATALHTDCMALRTAHPELADLITPPVIPPYADHTPDEFATVLYHSSRSLLKSLIEAVSTIQKYPACLATHTAVLLKSALLMPEYACKWNGIEVIEAIIGCTPRNEPDHTQLGSHNALLIYAASRGHTHLVEKILSYGCSLPSMAARAAARHSHHGTLAWCVTHHASSLGGALMLRRGNFTVVEGVFPHQTVLGNAVESDNEALVAYAMQVPELRASVDMVHGILDARGNIVGTTLMEQARKSKNTVIVDLLKARKLTTR